MKNKIKKNRKFFRNGFFKKNKKGFLLTEETLKVVVAVIGLIILVYFLVSLFYSGNTQEKTKQALSSVGEISNAVNSLSSGQKSVEVLQPQKWTMFSFVGEDKKPNSCFGENCLCICNKVNVDTLFGLLESRQLNECAETGACLVVNNLEKFEQIDIQSFKSTTNINISLINDKVVVRETE